MKKCAACGKLFDPEKDRSLVYCGICIRDVEELLVGPTRVES
jgi:hypothetical protein